jgi:hypothetical protein
LRKGLVPLDWVGVIAYDDDMPDSSDILARVRSAAAIKVLYLSHAVRQMMRSERMITTAEVRRVIAEGILIEDYPEDLRGHSCLISGRGDRERPIHLVCAPKPDYLAVITAYVPNPEEWSQDFTVRVKK